MNFKNTVILIGLGALLFSGCASDDARYYQALQAQQNQYLKEYSTVKNSSVTFVGKFDGKISIIKPKKLPQRIVIRRPKTTSEEALSWAKIILPTASMISGSYFNYKMADSSNKYNSENIKSWTGNFKNDTISTTNTSNTSTDKSVTYTSNTSTDKSVTNTSNTSTDNSSSNLVPHYNDGNTTLAP